MGEALFREHGRQVAALCWRVSPAQGPEILLVTSLSSKRWILPKGWAEADLTPAESAAREAFEEAGITGTIGAEPVGSFHYLKEKKDGSGIPCRVDVFALAVAEQLEEWPEKGARRMLWLSPHEAAARVAEPGLRQLLKTFQAQPVAAKRRRATL